jgi:hypothetical protein
MDEAEVEAEGATLAEPSADTSDRDGRGAPEAEDAPAA